MKKTEFLKIINFYKINLRNVPVAKINEECFFNEQCEALVFQTECRDGLCACRFERTPVFHKDGPVECIGKKNRLFCFFVQYACSVLNRHIKNQKHYATG